VNSDVWPLRCESIYCVLLHFRYIYCKAYLAKAGSHSVMLLLLYIVRLKPGLRPVSAETLFIWLQNSSNNTSSSRGLGVVIGGIRARSCDNRLRPESYFFI